MYLEAIFKLQTNIYFSLSLNVATRVSLNFGELPSTPNNVRGCSPDMLWTIVIKFGTIATTNSFEYEGSTGRTNLEDKKIMRTCVLNFV